MLKAAILEYHLIGKKNLVVEVGNYSSITHRKDIMQHALTINNLTACSCYYYHWQKVF